MAAPHIPIDQSARLGNKLRRLVTLYRETHDLHAELSAVANQCIDAAPDPDDYSHFETEFGIPTGKGADVVFMLNILTEKIETDAQVSGVKAARDALLNQLG